MRPDPIHFLSRVVCEARCLFGETQHCSKRLIYGFCIVKSSGDIWLKHDNVGTLHVLFVMPIRLSQVTPRGSGSALPSAFPVFGHWASFIGSSPSRVSMSDDR